jgi:hypothetical protein
MPTSIDFRQIRPYDGDKRSGFEELVCQLARREHTSEQGMFRRIEGAGGDGGVEAYFERPSGGKVGYQAKYFLATKDIDWGQIDASVKTAIRLHPTLERYVVAIPCDLTGRSGKLERGKTGWEHWETHKARWAGWCVAAGIRIEFIPWTKFDIVDRLASSAERRGLGLFWFNCEIFDQQWFASKFAVTKADLGERFQPDDHVTTALSGVFDGIARASDYKGFLADWFYRTPRPLDLGRHLRVAAPKTAELDVSGLDERLFQLREHGHTLAFIGAEPLPLFEWREDVKAAADLVMKLLQPLYEKSDRETEETIRDSVTKARQILHEIDTHLDTTPIHLAQGEHDIRVRADLTRSIVVVGEAGSGKSHLFADAVGRALAAGRPALLLLGQHFHGDGLRRAFLERLDLADQDFETVLQALNAAGEAARTRCMILIDALNEAVDLKVWPDDLAGFVSEILDYEWLCVGFSCRPEYEQYLIPEGVRQTATLLTCRGIRSPEEQEQAAVQYFEKRGIVRPAVPWLAPEFSNFLFFKVCCDSLRERGLSEFPRGLHGAQQVLSFYLESIASRVRRRFPEADFPAGAVVTAVKSIASRMARDHSNYVESPVASDICQSAFGSPGPKPNKTWLSVLIEEGVFRKDHLFAAPPDDPLAVPKEICRFTYQRFSDHLIVDALLREHTDVRAAFRAGGGMRFLVEHETPWELSTLWSALAVQIPEKHPGLELLDLIPDDRTGRRPSYYLEDAFTQSVLWRASSAFSDRTLELFNKMGGDFTDPRLEILIRLATLQDHPWNARQLLDPFLERLPMPERDAFWTVDVNTAAEDDGHPIWALVRWCLRADLSRAGTETLELAATVLCWVFTSSNRRIRDTATKALTAVITARPAIYPWLLRRCVEVDDLYVGERVYAAGFGAVCRGIGDPELREISQAVYQAIFVSKTPPLNINLRDYARALIEYAAIRSCLHEQVDLDRCSPPYSSTWPLEDTTGEELARIAEEAGSTEILSSAFRDFGDFARYEIETKVRHFSTIPLTDPQPRRDERELPRFDESFSKRWVTRRAYEYGWSARLFPSDRGRTDMTSLRPIVERVGKKYQWLALSEFLARLSDNVWAIEEWPDRAQIYDHPAYDWFVRDIEPSILVDPPVEEPTPWWQAHSLGIEAFEDADLAGWPFLGQPPHSSDWLEAYDAGGQYWLLLHGLFSSRERREESSPAVIAVQRQAFVRVSSIIVKSEDADEAMKRLEGARLSDPTDHGPIDWTDGPFLCEYPWRNTWSRRGWEVVEEGFRSLKGLNYIRPIVRHVWESHLDASLSEGLRLCLPHPWIAQQMGLRPDLTNPGQLVDGRTGETVFLDPGRASSGWAALVHEEKFFQFLRQENLECLWFVAGERNSYPSGQHGDFACRYFGSVYRRSNGAWIGQRWHQDQPRTRT